MGNESAMSVAGGLTTGLGAMGGCFIEGVVRQPERREPLQGRMFLLAGLIGVAMLLLFANPLSV